MPNPIVPSTSFLAPSQSGSGPSSATPQGAITLQNPAAGGKDASKNEVSSVSQHTPQEVSQAAQEVADLIQNASRSLQISVDKDLGSTIITVVDPDTAEVIRQIPEEEIVELARFFSAKNAELTTADEVTKGILMDQKG